MRPLTPLEARVLGVLVEKQATVPDSYPLSLNALVMGCNQKSARDPVMDASDTDVLGAVEGLKGLALLQEVSGARVLRYEHNACRAWQLPTQSVALLAVLMLRGPQTAAELRLNSDRLHRFADIGSVEAFLDELSQKEPPKVVKLARAPGAREARWAHRVGMPLQHDGAPPHGDAAMLQHHAASTQHEAMSTTGLVDVPDAAADISVGELVAIKAQLTRLTADVETLKAQWRQWAAELGLDPNRSPET
jgi:uncharacterized protein